MKSYDRDLHRQRALLAAWRSWWVNVFVASFFVLRWPTLALLGGFLVLPALSILQLLGFEIGGKGYGFVALTLAISLIVDWIAIWAAMEIKNAATRRTYTKLDLGAYGPASNETPDAAAESPGSEHR